MSQTRKIDYNSYIDPSDFPTIIGSIFGPSVLSGGTLSLSPTNSQAVAIAPVTLVTTSGVIIQESAIQEITVPSTGDYTIVYTYTTTNDFVPTYSGLQILPGLLGNVSNSTTIGWVRFEGSPVLRTEMLYQPPVNKLGSQQQITFNNLVTAQPQRHFFATNSYYPVPGIDLNTAAMFYSFGPGTTDLIAPVLVPSKGIQTVYLEARLAAGIDTNNATQPVLLNLSLDRKSVV